MEQIYKAVICGQKGILLYAKLTADGQKKYFEVDVSCPDVTGGHEISAFDFDNQIQIVGSDIFFVKAKVKYPALMIVGLDIPWDPLFDMFLFDLKVEKIFNNIINLTATTEHYELLDIEKAFYSNPGLYVTVRNKLQLWRKNNALPLNVIIADEKMCHEHGYVKLLHLIKSLRENFVIKK